ncbi:hypothetical protein [Rhodopirellula sp. P2]|uniref:hypothetical protein n=1 Tax=Rhodopirellula sp. P2 TaxID=2127060 RepID=UPI0023677D9B|nr:hypothetical protein [Rhodopirellula sp. P2]WDQ15714.1 hypothetical protein PSR62_18980 [Rhodopirellula sp. P2]
MPVELDREAKQAMNKVGTTSTGKVMVEMTAQEYNALLQITKLRPPAAVASPAKLPEAHSMTHAKRLEHVKPRLKKLLPKKRESVVRSIQAMFQHTGGISQSDVDAVIKALQKSGFFTIANSGKVAYPRLAAN